MIPRVRSRIAAAALLAPVVVALAGCGGAATPAPAAPAPNAAPSPPAACAQLRAIDLVPTPDSGPDQEPAPADVTAFATKIGPFVQQARTGAPADLAPTLDKMAQLVDGMRTTGKMPDFSDPAVLGAINGSEVWAHANCGFQNVDVAAVGARFEGVPTTLKAGTTSIALTNRSGPGPLVVGLVVRPKDQSLTAAAVQALPPEQLFGAVDVAPAAPAAPQGATSGAIVELTPGTWFLLNPVGDNGGPSAYQQGMVAQFTVS
jgi:hypothetical protein